MKRARRGPKNWRELRDELRALGASRIRTNGSHEKWRFDDGETFIVVCNHLGAAVPLGIRMQFRRLRERRGGSAGEEPAPLGRTGSQWSRLVPSESERMVDHGQRKQQWRQGRWWRSEGRRWPEGRRWRPEGRPGPRR